MEVEKQGESIKVRIRDYGKGLPHQIGGRISPANLGVGVTGMRERVRQFGGDLTVSATEPGTLVEAKIPLFGDLSSAEW